MVIGRSSGQYEVYDRTGRFRVELDGHRDNMKSMTEQAGDK